MFLHLIAKLFQWWILHLTDQIFSCRYEGTPGIEGPIVYVEREKKLTSFTNCVSFIHFLFIFIYFYLGAGDLGLSPVLEMTPFALIDSASKWKSIKH